MVKTPPTLRRPARGQVALNSTLAPETTPPRASRSDQRIISGVAAQPSRLPLSPAMHGSTTIPPDPFKKRSATPSRVSTKKTLKQRSSSAARAAQSTLTRWLNTGTLNVAEQQDETVERGRMHTSQKGNGARSRQHRVQSTPPGQHTDT